MLLDIAPSIIDDIIYTMHSCLGLESAASTQWVYVYYTTFSVLSSNFIIIIIIVNRCMIQEVLEDDFL